MEQRWILVEERLPEEHDSIFAKWKDTAKWESNMFEKISATVIVTAINNLTEKRVVTTAHTADGKWRLDTLWGVYTYRVIAWMPLPEPYREGEPKQTNADRIRSMTDEELATLVCKVGTQIYAIKYDYEQEKHMVTESEIIEVTQNCNGWFFKSLINKPAFRPRDFGRTVFFVKQEAEAKLKEMEGNYGEA